MPTIQKSDVVGAITVYLLNENRPCPAHYLTDKFGDDVAEVVAQLKKDGAIIGKRGRGGGIVFPDTVFVKKDKNTSSKIEATPVQTIDEIADSIIAGSEEEIVGERNIQLEEVPF